MSLQLLGGLATLETALPEDYAADLSEARQYLLKAVAEPKDSITEFAHLMLAEMEFLGAKKRKEERIQHHLQQVRSPPASIQ